MLKQTRKHTGHKGPIDTHVPAAKASECSAAALAETSKRAESENSQLNTGMIHYTI